MERPFENSIYTGIMNLQWKPEFYDGRLTVVSIFGFDMEHAEISKQTNKRWKCVKDKMCIIILINKLKSPFVVIN